MSNEDLFGAPAGWYPDPLGLPQLRWWNNHAWTEQTSAARQPMVVQDTKFAWADDAPADSSPDAAPQAGGDRDSGVADDETADPLRELEPPRAFAKIDQDAPAGEHSAADAGSGQDAKWWSAPRGTESRRAAAAAAAAAAQQAAARRAQEKPAVPSGDPFAWATAESAPQQSAPAPEPQQPAAQAAPQAPVQQPTVQQPAADPFGWATQSAATPSAPQQPVAQQPAPQQPAPQQPAAQQPVPQQPAAQHAPASDPFGWATQPAAPQPPTAPASDPFGWATQPAAAPTAQQPTAPPAAPQQPAAFGTDPFGWAAPVAPVQQPAPTAPQHPATAPIADAFSWATGAPQAPIAAPAPSTSLDSLFDTSTWIKPDESLDAIFGSPRTRRSTRARTPIEQEGADAVETVPAPAPAPVAARAAAPSGPVWLIAAIPVLQLVLAVLAVNSLPMGNNAWAMYLVIGVSYALTVGLAVLDRMALLRSGLEQPPHWAWAFLTAPVYLVLRARATLRQSGHGIGPVLVWFGLAALQVVSIVAVPGLAISTLPSVFTSQIEQSVAANAAIIAGTDMTVECPTTPPALPGQEILCTYTTATSSATVTVTLARENGWISWKVTDWGTYATGD